MECKASGAVASYLGFYELQCNICEVKYREDRWPAELSSRWLSILHTVIPLWAAFEALSDAFETRSNAFRCPPELTAALALPMTQPVLESGTDRNGSDRPSKWKYQISGTAEHYGQNASAVSIAWTE